MFIEPVLFLTKTRKKPLAVFIINTCLYKKVSIISYLSRKKHPTCRGKTIETPYFSRKNLKQNLFSENLEMSSQQTNLSSRLLIKSVFLEVINANANAAAISLTRIMRLGVGHWQLFYCSSCFCLLNQLFSNYWIVSFI